MEEGDNCTKYIAPEIIQCGFLMDRYTGDLRPVFIFSGISCPTFALLADDHSYRVIVMTGGMLAAGGMCLSYGAENIYVLIGAYGLLTGFGMSMIYTPSQVIGALYFDKKRSLATGLIQTASAVGSLSGPLLCVALIENYTWHGTMFILGGMYLQTVAAAAMFRGIPRAAKEELKKRRKDRNTRLGFLMDRYDGDIRPVFILSGISCIVSGVLQGGALCINYRQKHASEERPQSGRRETLDTILEETRC
ncbi:PREDICTED: monocarboxylate transporter 12-B-like [Priapulus caudatus]|uniref:Monocarboxylate transporter 12-B-like n=1 Tax=Priapulus caudatus TaxID=37621 RepID=A0ABM1E2E2_PRICU|nr:PREDICTED: monocarboxylate transporter 12-B-like [Priapulus caudatus]